MRDDALKSAIVEVGTDEVIKSGLGVPVKNGAGCASLEMPADKMGTGVAGPVSMPVELPGVGGAEPVWERVAHDAFPPSCWASSIFSIRATVVMVCVFGRR